MNEDREIIVKSPYDDYKLSLVDWDKIKPYCRREDCLPFKNTDFKQAFLNLWFRTNDQGERYFITGAIYYNDVKDEISFINGRHRTNLLLLYGNIIPIAIDNSLAKNPALQNAILKTTEREFKFSLPPLPILKIDDLRSSCV